MNTTPETREQIPPDETVIFIPDKEIRGIEQTLDKLEEARQEFQKISEKIRSIET